MIAIDDANNLTLVTFNIWFGDYFQDRRLDALFDILRSADADIIGLQEVVPRTLRAIREQDWIAAEYQIADVSVVPYGVLLLSRVPVKQFTVHALPTEMTRELVVAELEPIGKNTDSTVVATVHLESLYYADFRRRQLERIFSILDNYENAVLMGDFNMCSSWDENRHVRPDYLDIWPKLHPDEPGWTEDTDINTMRSRVSSKPTQVRFDRVIVRSNAHTWRPTHIERLGTASIAPDLPDVFPSDHFGLRAVIDTGTLHTNTHTAPSR